MLELQEELVNLHKEGLIMGELPKITAKHIKELLKAKHDKDVFYTEVKTGESWTDKGKLRIMDAWAMKISWANPLVIAYEIKISRADFLNDTKWHNYLQYCNEFYFVCPYGMIEKRELPPNVGLIYVTKNGSMLRKVSKAAYRRVTIPESLFRYLLFYRARNSTPALRTVETWKRYLKQKANEYEIGQACSKKIQRDLQELRDRERQNQINESTVDKAVKVLEAYAEITGRDMIRTYLNHVDKQQFAQSLGIVDISMVEDLRRIADKIETNLKEKI